MVARSDTAKFAEEYLNGSVKLSDSLDLGDTNDSYPVDFASRRSSLVSLPKQSGLATQVRTVHSSGLDIDEFTVPIAVEGAERFSSTVAVVPVFRLPAERRWQPHSAEDALAEPPETQEEVERRALQKQLEEARVRRLKRYGCHQVLPPFSSAASCNAVRVAAQIVARRH
jgi:hypothetical protein